MIRHKHILCRHSHGHGTLIDESALILLITKSTQIVKSFNDVKKKLDPAFIFLITII